MGRIYLAGKGILSRGNKEKSRRLGSAVSADAVVGTGLERGFGSNWLEPEWMILTDPYRLHC